MKLLKLSSRPLREKLEEISSINSDLNRLVKIEQIRPATRKLFLPEDQENIILARENAWKLHRTFDRLAVLTDMTIHSLLFASSALFTGKPFTVSVLLKPQDAMRDWVKAKITALDFPNEEPIWTPPAIALTPNDKGKSQG